MDTNYYCEYLAEHKALLAVCKALEDAQSENEMLQLRLEALRAEFIGCTTAKEDSDEAE